MIDPENVETFDDGYYNGLSESNQEEFEELFESKLGNTSSQSAKRRLRSRYDHDIEHFELIRAACGCFHPGGGAANAQSNFQFVGTDLLAGIRKTPADVALVKEEYNQVTVEVVCCEIGGETRGQWIENINTVHEFLNGAEVRDQLKQKLDVDDRDLSIGYITLVREEDTTDLEYSILESECNAPSYAIWECDSGDRCIRQIEGQLNHPELEAVFQGDVDYLRRDQSLHVAIDSHPVIGLEEMIFRLVKENSEFGRDEIDEFDRDDFRSGYEQLFTVFCDQSSRDRLIDGEVDRQIRSARQSQIVTTDSDRRNTSREYRVVYSGARGPQHAQDAVESRYFDHMSQYKVGEKAYFETKEEFNPSTGLSDFQ